MAQTQHFSSLSGIHIIVGNRIGILSVLWVVVIFVTPMFSAQATADGYSSSYYSMLERWEALAEKDQFCIINYHDGIEKMVVKIQLDGRELRSSDKVAWLFPVPGDPESVSVKHFQATPMFYGDSLGSAVLDRVADSTSWGVALGTQLYTIPAVVTTYLLTSGFGSASGGRDSEFVEVSSALEQYGVTSEVLTAQSPAALDDYLVLKGLTLPQEAQAITADYLDGDHSFVLSWISDVPTFLEEASRMPEVDAYSVGVCVEFPSDDIFFPLKMTSAYGELEIPITVQIVGHVTPKAYPSSDDLSFSFKYDVQEFFGPVYRSSMNYTEYEEDYDYFFSEQIAGNDGKRHFKSIDYTEVIFDGPASELSEDLLLSDSRPLVVSTLNLVYDYPWLVVLTVFVWVSCVSSFIACTIIFGWNARLAWTYVILGLANLLTIVGYFFAYRYVKPMLRYENVNVERKTWRLILVFSVVFFCILVPVYLSFFLVPTVGM